MRDNEKQVYLELDKKLWSDVGIYAAMNNTTRKDVVTTALQNVLKTKGGNNNG